MKKKSPLSLALAIMLLAHTVSSMALVNEHSVKNHPRSFPDYDLAVHCLSVNGMTLNVEFSMTPKKENYLGENQRLSFEATADGQKLVSCIIETASKYDDGKLGYSAVFDMSSMGKIPDAITFTPYIRTYTPQGAGKNPLIDIDRREADAFTVKMGEGDGQGYVHFGD